MLAMMMVTIEYAMEWITSPGKDGPGPRIFNNSIASFLSPRGSRSADLWWWWITNIGSFCMGWNIGSIFFLGWHNIGSIWIRRKYDEYGGEQSCAIFYFEYFLHIYSKIIIIILHTFSLHPRAYHNFWKWMQCIEVGGIWEDGS